MAKDPVCGMEVNEKTAKFESEHDGKIIYFCNKHCKMQFDQDPEKYLNK